MTRTFRIATPLAFVAAISCSHGSSAPAKPPTPAPAPAATPAAGGARGGAVAGGVAGGAANGAPGRGGPPGAGGPPGPGGRGPTMTPEQRAVMRDSITALRAETVKQMMAQIAGHETEPAGKVFKNVQSLKDVPAGQFITRMDAYGRALSYNCSSCHIPGDYASDSLARKKTARAMVDIVASINANEMTKLGRPRAPQIQCMTCHRGNQSPGNAIMP